MRARRDCARPWAARHWRVGSGAPVKSESDDSDDTDHRFHRCGPSTRAGERNACGMRPIPDEALLAGWCRGCDPTLYRRADLATDQCRPQNATTRRVCKGQSLRGGNMQSHGLRGSIQFLVKCTCMDVAFHNWSPMFKNGPSGAVSQVTSRVLQLISWWAGGKLSALPNLHESLVSRFYFVLVASAQPCTPWWSLCARSLSIRRRPQHKGGLAKADRGDLHGLTSGAARTIWQIRWIKHPSPAWAWRWADIHPA